MFRYWWLWQEHRILGIGDCCGEGFHILGLSRIGYDAQDVPVLGVDGHLPIVGNDVFLLLKDSSYLFLSCNVFSKRKISKQHLKV